MISDQPWFLIAGRSGASLPHAALLAESHQAWRGHSRACSESVRSVTKEAACRAGGGLSIATSGWPGQHSDCSEAHGGGGPDPLSWRTGSCAQPAAQPWSPVRLLQRLSSLLGSSTLVAAG